MICAYTKKPLGKSQRVKRPLELLIAASIGRVKIFEYFMYTFDLKEPNKLRTRIIFFLKLDSGKSGPSP